MSWVALWRGRGLCWHFLEKENWPKTGVFPDDPLRQAWNWIIDHVREKAELSYSELALIDSDLQADVMAILYWDKFGRKDAT